MVIVFVRHFPLFVVFDGGDLLLGSSAIMVFSLMLGVVFFVKVGGLFGRGCFCLDA